MSNEEIKPCPDCNNTVIELCVDDDGEAFYRCESCGFCSPWSKDVIEAKQKWNSLLRQSYVEQLERNMMGLQQVRAEHKELENRYKDAMQSLFNIGAIVREATCQTKNL